MKAQLSTSTATDTLEVCENKCRFKRQGVMCLAENGDAEHCGNNDGVCLDGAIGSEGDSCEFGEDCDDCTCYGARTRPLVPSRTHLTTAPCLMRGMLCYIAASDACRVSSSWSERWVTRVCREAAARADTGVR